jgi:hypothetical protein
MFVLFLTYLYKVAIHFVSIEICVIGVAVSVVHAQGLLLYMGQDSRLRGREMRE